MRDTSQRVLRATALGGTALIFVLVGTTAATADPQVPGQGAPPATSSTPPAPPSSTPPAPPSTTDIPTSTQTSTRTFEPTTPPVESKPTFTPSRTARPTFVPRPTRKPTTRRTVAPVNPQPSAEATSESTSTTTTSTSSTSVAVTTPPSTSSSSLMPSDEPESGGVSGRGVLLVGSAAVALTAAGLAVRELRR